MVNETPFLFSGSVRDNMDPRGEKNDKEIQACLQDAGLWEALQTSDEDSRKKGTTEAKLSHILVDAGR